MVVEIPAYWKEQRDWRRSRCDVLVGQCACGRIHSIQENWVKEQLRLHGAVILNLPQPEGADVSEPETPVSPTMRRSRDNVFGVDPNISRQAEDRLVRSNSSPTMPSNGTWWADPSLARAPAAIPSLDMTPYENLDLPIEFQERVDNAEGAMEGCGCTACESRREAERERCLREWVQTAQMVRDSLDAEDADAWARDNCNEQGQVPLFCDCTDCCNTRLQARNTNRSAAPSSDVQPSFRLRRGSSNGEFIEDESSVMQTAMANFTRAAPTSPRYIPDSE